MNAESADQEGMQCLDEFKKCSGPTTASVNRLLARLLSSVLLEARRIARTPLLKDSTSQDRLRHIGDLADAFHNFADCICCPSPDTSTLIRLRECVVDYESRYPESPPFVRLVDAAIGTVLVTKNT